MTRSIMAKHAVMGKRSVIEKRSVILRRLCCLGLVLLSLGFIAACADPGSGVEAELGLNAPAATNQPAADSGAAESTTEESVALTQGVSSTANSVWLADLTWTEVADRLAQGVTTVIIPTGGTEQNGPHMALDKHNTVVAHTAEQIALRSGSTLVAPVMAYVPEGDPTIMDNHLRWAGTISVPDATFSAVLEATARSLKGHGFTTIVFLGDSGSSQAAQSASATRLMNEWAGQGITIANMSGYYGANGQTEFLIAQGESQENIGVHAGIRDTSEVLAVAPELIRRENAAASTTPPGQLDARGVDGDPTRASAIYGAELLELKISAGVSELTALRGG